VRPPCPLGPVGCSHTDSGPAVLTTRALLPGHHPIRLGAGGLEGGHGSEPCTDLLTILRLTERQQSSLEATAKKGGPDQTI
jgi:hypothetical protein